MGAEPIPHKHKKYSAKCCYSLPVLSGAIAAILTEGKSVHEMETLGLFLSALANDIFLIASTKSKNDIFFDDFPPI